MRNRIGATVPSKDAGFIVLQDWRAARASAAGSRAQKEARGLSIQHSVVLVVLVVDDGRAIASGDQWCQAAETKNKLGGETQSSIEKGRSREL